MEYTMFLRLSVILFGLFVQTSTTRPRSVNLNLETIMEFRNNDNSADIRFLDKVQNFISKVKKSISSRPRRRQLKEELLTFTDFLKQVLEVLVECKDGDFEDILAVFEDEIRKYHYRGCKFYELFHDDEGLRRSLGEALDNMKNTEVDKAKARIKLLIEKLSRNKQDNKPVVFLEYLNSLYADKDILFKSFLNNLNHILRRSKRTNIDLVRVIRDGLRRILFDHYSNLNVNARRELKIKLKGLWKDITNNINNEFDFAYGKSNKELNIKINSNKHNNQENVRDDRNSLYDTGRDGIRDDKYGKDGGIGRQKEHYADKFDKKPVSLINKPMSSEERFWNNFHKLGIKSNAHKSHKSNVRENREGSENATCNYNEGKCKKNNDGGLIGLPTIDNSNINTEELTKNKKTGKNKMNIKRMNKSQKIKSKLTDKSKLKHYVDETNDSHKEDFREFNYNTPNNKRNSQNEKPVKNDVKIDDDELLIENKYKYNAKENKAYKSNTKKNRNKKIVTKTTREIFKENYSDSLSSDSEQNDKKITINRHNTEILKAPKVNPALPMKGKLKYHESAINKKYRDLSNGKSNKRINPLYKENIAKIYKNNMKDGESVIIIAADEKEDIHKLFKKKRSKHYAGTKDKVANAILKKGKNTKVVSTTAIVPIPEEEELITDPKVVKEGVKPTTSDGKFSISLASGSTEEEVLPKAQKTKIKNSDLKAKFKKTIGKFIPDTNSMSEESSKEAVIKNIKFNQEKDKQYDKNDLEPSQAKNSLRYNFINNDPEIRVKYLKNVKRNRKAKKEINEKSSKFKITGRILNKVTPLHHHHRTHKEKHHGHRKRDQHKHINLYKKARDPTVRAYDSNENMKRKETPLGNYRKRNDDSKIETPTISKSNEKFLEMDAENKTNYKDSLEDISGDKYTNDNRYLHVTLAYWKGTDATETNEHRKTIETSITPTPTVTITRTSNIIKELKKSTIKLKNTVTNIKEPIKLFVPADNKNITIFNKNYINNNTSTKKLQEVIAILEVKDKSLQNTTKKNNKRFDFRASNITQNNIMKTESTTINDVDTTKREFNNNETLVKDINFTNNNAIKNKINKTEGNINKSTNNEFQHVNTSLKGGKSNITRRLFKNDDDNLENDEFSIEAKSKLDFKPRSLPHQVAKIILNESNIIDLDDRKYKGIKEVMAKDLESIFETTTTTTEAPTTVTEALDVIEDALDLY